MSVGHELIIDELRIRLNGAEEVIGDIEELCEQLRGVINGRPRKSPGSAPDAGAVCAWCILGGDEVTNRPEVAQRWREDGYAVTALRPHPPAEEVK
jgi:hypothetical protein